MTPTPPSPNSEALRSAYLNLLKLGLCDLIGTATGSVEGLAHGRLAARDLHGDERRLREEGRDWPEHGLTMTGLARLDDLQACVEEVVRDGIAGDLIEAGSWRGGSSMLMRATLDTLGDRERTVYVADSFQGFPAVDGPSPDHPQTVEPYLGVFDFLAAPLKDVRASFTRLGLDRGVEFAPGFFEQTLPALAGHPWSVVRLDGDTYEATLLALRCLYPSLARGGHLIVDDYVAFDECRAAVERFRDDNGIDDPLESVDWTCVRWRKRSDADPTTVAPPMVDRAVRPVTRPAHGRVPSRSELELAARIAELEAELAVSPLRRLIDQIRPRQRSSRF